MRFRSVRNRVTILVAVVALVTLVILTLGFNLGLRKTVETDVDRVLRAQADAEREALSVGDNGLKLIEPRHESDSDAPVWAYESGMSLERGAGPDSVQRLADSLAKNPGAFADDLATQTRLYSEAIAGPSGDVGSVVTSISLEPFERTEARALILSLIFDAVIFVLIVVGARAVVGRALRPVAQMTEQAAAWSEHDLDHRFNLGAPTDELMELAATFDQMLARLAASFRRERRFSAEISHELRTPLAAISAEAELALKQQREPDRYRDALAKVSAKAAELEQILESLLAAARAESSDQRAEVDLEAAVVRVRDSFSELAARRGLEIEFTAPASRVLVEGDEEIVTRILSPIVENACRYGRRSVVLDIRSEGHFALVSVADDGPGLEPDELEQIFEPGVRGKGADSEDPARGAGLGLALARRLASALNGEVRALDADRGACFEMTIPLRWRPKEPAGSPKS